MTCGMRDAGLTSGIVAGFICYFIYALRRDRKEILTVTSRAVCHVVYQPVVDTVR